MNGQGTISKCDNKRGNVAVQSEKLESLITALSGKVENLSLRLSPVKIEGINACSGQEPKKTSPPRCAYANFLEARCETLERVINMLNEIMDTLDL